MVILKCNYVTGLSGRGDKWYAWYGVPYMGCLYCWVKVEQLRHDIGLCQHLHMTGHYLAPGHQQYHSCLDMHAYMLGINMHIRYDLVCEQNL